MASPKLSILVMRDDAVVRRMRFRAVWIRIVVWLFVLFVLLAFLNGALAWWLYQRYSRSLAADHERDRTIAELRVQLERCQNMEKMLHTAKEEQRAADGVAGPKPAAAPVPAPAPQEPPQTVEPPVPAAPSPARLNNVTARSRANRQIRLSFGLSNTESGTVLSGRVQVALMLKSGGVADLPHQDELEFQIARFKPIAASFALPEGIGIEDVEAVRIQVQANAYAPLTEVFSFPTPVRPSEGAPAS